MNEEEKTLIKWLMEHPLWTHDHFIPVPPAGMDVRDMFDENSDGTFSVVDRSDWPIENVGDGGFEEAVHVSYVFVNPLTESIEVDDSLNTAFRVWVEAGGWYDQSQDTLLLPSGGWNQYNKWISEHDYRLNCGAPTVTEAFLQLAELVKTYYNDDGSPKEVEND
jgi:hypothetical protein